MVSPEDPSHLSYCRGFVDRVTDGYVIYGQGNGKDKKKIEQDWN